ncbi:MAG: hypothetical protein RL693_447 [Verrucomicrobiota bacterium]|jgi:glycerate dehydrogenase
MPALTVLDAYTTNPGDLSWSGFDALAACTYHDRSAASEIIDRAKDCEFVLTNKTVLNGATLRALPKLKYIGVLATGYNVVDIATAKELGIVVSNVPGYSTPSVAQTVFALLLELTHRVGHHAQTVREGRWAKSTDFCYWDGTLTELSGRTLGIYGYGTIGEAVAKIATAMEMRVIAYRRTWREQPLVGVEQATSESIFAESDVLTLHCPLTESTKDLINSTSIARMKSSAFLINTARGPLVHEADLANALNEGRLAGAGLDVLSAEPQAADNPLQTAKNCFITPHIAWASKEARARLIAMATENVKAFIAGSPKNIVS